MIIIMAICIFFCRKMFLWPSEAWGDVIMALPAAAARPIFLVVSFFAADGETMADFDHREKELCWKYEYEYISCHFSSLSSIETDEMTAENVAFHSAI